MSFSSSCIHRVKDYLLSAKIFNFGQNWNNTPFSVSFCWWVGRQGASLFAYLAALL